MCFGGYDRQELNDGSEKDLRDKSFKKILGSENVMKFACISQEDRVSSQKFFTLVEDDNLDIHMMQLFTSKHGSYFETRSIKIIAIRVTEDNLNLTGND